MRNLSETNLLVALLVLLIGGHCGGWSHHCNLSIKGKGRVLGWAGLTRDEGYFRAWEDLNFRQLVLDGNWTSLTLLPLLPFYPNEMRLSIPYPHFNFIYRSPEKLVKFMMRVKVFDTSELLVSGLISIKTLKFVVSGKSLSLLKC